VERWRRVLYGIDRGAASSGSRIQVAVSDLKTSAEKIDKGGLTPNKKLDTTYDQDGELARMHVRTPET